MLGAHYDDIRYKFFRFFEKKRIYIFKLSILVEKLLNLLVLQTNFTSN
jgi:hypothetical protein